MLLPIESHNGINPALNMLSSLEKIDLILLLVTATACTLGRIVLGLPGFLKLIPRPLRIIFNVILNSCFVVALLILIRRAWLILTVGNLKPPPVVLIHSWLAGLLRWALSTARWLYNFFSLYPLAFLMLAALLGAIFLSLALIPGNSRRRNFFIQCLLIQTVFCGGIWIFAQVQLISPETPALSKMSFAFEPLINLGNSAVSLINDAGTIWNNHWLPVLAYGTVIFLVLTGLVFFLDKRCLPAMLFIGAFFCTLNGLFLGRRGHPLASGLSLLGTVFLLFIGSFLTKQHLVSRRKHSSLAISVGLALIVIFAMAVSLYQLDLYPFTYYYSEGITGVRSLNILNADLELHSKLWYQKLTRNPQSEACPFLVYPIALSFQIFSLDHNWVSLRLHSVASNAFCVLFLYLLVSQIFSRPVGLIAAGLLAGSGWFISQTRIAQYFSQTILYSLICYYLLWKAVRTANLLYYALLGIGLGLAIHFYAPARVVIIISGVFLLFKIVSGTSFIFGHYRGILILVFFFLLTLLISGYRPKNYFVSTLSQDEWWYKRHSHFGRKSGELEDTIVYYSQWFRHNSLPIYENLFREWGIFWDRNFLFNERILTLNPFLRVFVILSIVYSLTRLYQDRYFFVLIWLVISSFPAVLTHYAQRRTILMIPALAVLAAFGIVTFAQAINQLIQKRRSWPGYLLAGLMMITVVATDLGHYFFHYRKPSSQRTILLNKQAYNQKINELLGKYFLYTDAYHAGMGWPDTVRFNAMIARGDRDGDSYVQGTLEKLELHFFSSKPDDPVAFLVNPGIKSSELLEKIKTAYPESRIQEQKDSAGRTRYLTLIIDAEK